MALGTRPMIKVELSVKYNRQMSELYRVNCTLEVLSMNKEVNPQNKFS